MNEAKQYNREVKQWLDKVKVSVSDYRRKDRRSILRKGAAPVRKTARSLTPVGKRVHKRYSGGTVVATYNPGNLRRSIKTLTFSKSPDVFVGPKFSTGETKGEFGGPGQPVDGYYFRMVFGSTSAFYARVLQPAIAVNRSKVVRQIGLASKKKIIEYAKRRGVAA